MSSSKLDIILKALSVDEKATAQIVFGSALNKAEAMRLFIESRQDWCEVQIMDRLKELINK